MRYWQSEVNKQIVLSEYDLNEIQAQYYINNQPWTEVLVIPKPQPKTWTKKVALFKYYNGAIYSWTEEELNRNPHTKNDRISDWVEVTFTEKDSQNGRG